jgi:hypothetical protein
MAKASLEQRFDAEILDGHKGPAVIVPFDPAKTWNAAPAKVPAPWKSGYLVKGKMNKTAFEGWIGHRWGRSFILVDEGLQQRLRAKVGDVVTVAVVPRVASTETDPALDALFAGRRPQVRAIYDELLKHVRKLGPVIVEPKKTSIHLVSGTAFAGVHPRKSSVLLNIKTAAALKSPRIKKIEQPSKNRFHNELVLASPSDVDAELLKWLAAAYELTTSRD